MVAVILNCCFTTSIAFMKYSMVSGQVAVQVPPPSRHKMLQQLTAMGEEVLYVIFTDLHKAYGALDRSICL